jgi:hypothetical protein
MRGKNRIALGLLGLMLAGCASTSDARYVYQDGEFGVVAIPRNTSDGPNHYRQQAEALMAQHFPEGYEIIRAEEVVEGSRTLTVGKTGTTEITPQVAPHLLALLKIGGTLTRSQADTLALHECRIIYKKADPHSASALGGFAPEPSLTPTCYLDPNKESKKQEKEPVKAAQATSDQQPARARDRLAGE